MLTSFLLLFAMEKLYAKIVRRFVWFVGHFALVLAVARYLLSAVTFNSSSAMAQASYRFAFIAAAVTYGIVVYKTHFARGTLRGSLPDMVLTLAGDENVQYLRMMTFFEPQVNGNIGQLTNSLIDSDGTCLAIRASNYHCRSSFWNLFLLPRGHVYSQPYYSNHPASENYRTRCCFSFPTGNQPVAPC